MKKVTLLLFLVFSLSGSVIFAQTVGQLWGMTNIKGDSSGGVLFSYDVTTSQYNVIHPFTIQSGTQPYCEKLLLASDGNFYGMTNTGGANGDGTLFKCDSLGRATTLINFNATNGANPYGGLIQGTDGNLYGMTCKGGSSGEGNIFKYNIATGVITNLAIFTGTNGCNPYGDLLQASDGNLYGMTNTGGTKNYGIIFKCTTSGTLTTLVNFTSTNGANPTGNLIQATDGNLYGMTYYGGTINCGTLFKCTTSGTLTNLLFFNSSGANTVAARPTGTPIQATDGNLYGLTYEGGVNNNGSVFEYNMTSGVLTTIHSFPVGAYPRGSLVQASDGNFYGTTSGAGTSGNGTLFKCTTSGTVTTLVNFHNTNGAKPYANLIQASNGSLYGTTFAGGTVNDGVLFKCSTTGSLSVLYNFGSTPIGFNPYGTVIQAKDGNIYGMTYSGGLYNEGTVFKCTPSGVLSTFYNFNDSAGANPYGSLIQASDGNFYGMTLKGGPKNDGVIFKLTTSGNFDTLISFNGTNGATPYGSLIQAIDGNLYGMTYAGGTKNLGTVFKCTTSGSFTTLVNFNDTNGGNPYGDLMQAKDSNLYGMTYLGGGSGLIFKYTKKGKDTVLYALGGSSMWWSGDSPHGNLIQANDSNLYGMTIWGGTSGYGNILQYSPYSNTMLSSYSFSAQFQPTGSLVLGTDGNMYAMMTGNPGNGDIIKYTTSKALTVYLSLNSAPALGASPYGNFCEVMSMAIIDSACLGTTLMAPVRGGKFPYTYSWSTGATTSSIQGVSAANTYSVTVTDARGITLTDTFIFKTLTVTTDSAQGICTGDSAHLTAVSNGGTGTIIYNWMPNSLSGSSIAIKPVSSTTYTVTVTDISGCKSSATQAVTINPLPVINITGNNLLCSGSTDTLIAGGAQTYTWKPNSFLSSTTGDSVMASPLTTKTYTVTGTSSAGCVSTQTLTVKVTATPAVQASSIQAYVCPGDSSQLVASGATTYTWAPDSGLSATTGATVIASPPYSITYTVTGIKAGCSASYPVTLPVAPTPTLTISGDSIICAGNITTLTAGGAKSYAWAPAAYVNNSADSIVTAFPATNTTYTITGTGANGCIGSTLEPITVTPTNGFDLAGNLYVCIDTPSFSNASIQACIFNNRCQLTNGTLKLVLDTAFHITSTTADSAAHVSGDTLIWNYDSLSDIGKTHCVTLNGHISNIPAGDSAFVTMLITPTLGDSVPANNSVTYWVKPTEYKCQGLPFDPNTKSVLPEGNISATQQLSYTIHFQNTGTAPAHNVVVVDTLSAFVDPTTLKVTSSSANVVTTISSGNIVSFTFNNINLPDTGTSKTSSIGIVKYSISPKVSAAPGDVIKNTAGIYFDANPVVLTNTTVSAITGSPTSVQNISTALNIAAFPNPFTTATSIVFNTDGLHYLEVDDVTGRKMESVECSGKQYELSRKNLADGVYFIRAYDAEHKYIAVQKIVVE